MPHYPAPRTSTIEPKTFAGEPIIVPTLPAEHPVTRLIALGPEMLTTAELIEIIFTHTGAPLTSRAAANVLAGADNSLRLLARDYPTTLHSMQRAHPTDIARLQAAILHAVFEL